MGGVFEDDWPCLIGESRALKDCSGEVLGDANISLTKCFVWPFSGKRGVHDPGKILGRVFYFGCVVASANNLCPDELAAGKVLHSFQVVVKGPLFGCVFRESPAVMITNV